MDARLNKIQQIISELNGISIETPFSSDSEFTIVGKIKVLIDESDEALIFDLKIYAEYPFKRLDTESITFFNTDLLEYGHVMGNGSICIHTSHNIDLKKKIEIDINSLKRWIVKYYLNKENDDHYEHIILQPKEFNNAHFSYLFTEVDYSFNKNQFGFFEYSKINDGLYLNKTIFNHIIQRFKTPFNTTIAECKWSNHIKQLESNNIGLYLFVDNPPTTRKKFIISNWEDLGNLVTQDFFKFLDNVQKNSQKIKGNPIPLLIGYKISELEIHWQVAILEIGKFPIKSFKENQVWKGRFIDENIIWSITRNCSYDYFFGRGKLADKITQYFRRN
jgi:hypothetical protein